jgi:hypothetical protein
MSHRVKVEMNLPPENWTPLSGDRQDHIASVMISYWGRKEVQLLAGEDTPLRSELQKASQQYDLEDQVCLREGFPLSLIEFFKKNGLSLWRLPELNLKGRTSEYIDFLKSEDMPKGTSVARFKDRRNRPGFALHIQGKRLLESPILGVIAIFKRYSDPEDQLWMPGGREQLIPTIMSCYNSSHAVHHVGKDEESCDNCPRFGEGVADANINFVQSVVSGADQEVEVVSEIAQVEQPLPVGKEILEGKNPSTS